MSVDLTTFFPQGVGVLQNIEAKALAYKIVGTGSFSAITQNSVNFSGNGNNPFTGAPFSLTISLTICDDTNCEIQLNGNNQPATHEVDVDGYLDVTISSGTEAGEIQMIAGDGGTYFYPDVAGGHDLWLGPASSSRRRLYVQSHNGRTIVM